MTSFQIERMFRNTPQSRLINDTMSSPDYHPSQDSTEDDDQPFPLSQSPYRLFDSPPAESFVCFTRPKVHVSELIWHLDDFLDLRRMTAMKGFQNGPNVYRGDVIFSPVVETSTQHRWRVALFPNGTKESRGHVGVYVLVHNTTIHSRLRNESISSFEFNKLLKSVPAFSDDQVINLSEVNSQKNKSQLFVQAGYQEWQKGLRHWKKSENGRSYDSFQKNSREGNQQMKTHYGKKRYYLKFALEILDMKGCSVMGTRVEQSIQSVETGSFWGYPKYLTVIDENDLSQFLEALGGSLRLCVSVEFCNAIKTVPAINKLTRSSSSSLRQLSNQPTFWNGTTHHSKHQQQLSSNEEHYNSSVENVHFLEQLRSALISKPDELFDMEVRVGKTIRLRANRCPLLATMLCLGVKNDEALPTKHVVWPDETEDPEVVSAILQYIHFDSCDLVMGDYSNYERARHQLNRLVIACKELQLTGLGQVAMERLNDLE